jgi:hypothetical protein
MTIEQRTKRKYFNRIKIDLDNDVELPWVTNDVNSKQTNLKIAISSIMIFIIVLFWKYLL